MAARYRPSYNGIGEMARSAWMEAEMRRRAEKIKAAAILLSPEKSGRYKASWDVSSTNRGGPKEDRATARVANTSPYAAHIEWGTSYMRGQHVLTRAVAMAGGD